MRFKKYAEYSSGLQPIILAPFINIVLLVFIFCGLCFAYALAPSGLGVHLPRAITSRAIQGPMVQVSVMEDGSLRLNGEGLTVEQFVGFLKQTANRRQTVVINADSRASWRHVVRAWEAVRASGLADCVMAAHP